MKANTHTRSLVSLRTSLAGFVFVALMMSTTAVNAQSEEADKDLKETTAEVQESLKTLNTHMKEGEWSKVQELMSEKAWDKYCQSLVRRCVSLTKIEVDIPIPGIDEAKDAISEVLEQHGLDELEVEDGFKLQIGSADDEEEEEDGDEDESDEEESLKDDPIIKALDKDDNRVEIVESLFQAQMQSPFNMSVFNGKVIELEKAEGEAGRFFVKVEPQIQERDEGGTRFRMVSPPVIVIVEKSDDVWVYAGVDSKRTSEAMKDFNPRGGGAPRTDF